MCPAPEHFGDTILFTMDEDILEAIFCLDDTFDMDAESLCGLQPEEALRRPSTADGEGQDERPFTQAGLGAQDQVGLEWAWGVPKVSLCSTVWPQTHSLPASASQAVGQLLNGSLLLTRSREGKEDGWVPFMLLGLLP